MTFFDFLNFIGFGSICAVVVWGINYINGRTYRKIKKYLLSHSGKWKERIELENEFDIKGLKLTKILKQAESEGIIEDKSANIDGADRYFLFLIS